MAFRSPSDGAPISTNQPSFETPGQTKVSGVKTIINLDLGKGPILYYVRTYGNFPLLYVVKMSLRRWVGGSIKPQNTLT